MTHTHFELGDVVTLKGGKTTMVIEGICLSVFNRIPQVKLVWFDGYELKRITSTPYFFDKIDA